MRPRCRIHKLEVWLRFAGDSPLQVDLGMIALIMHSNTVVRPGCERQVIEALAALLVVGIPHFLHRSVRKFQAMLVALREHKHDAIGDATTVIDVQRHRG